MSEKQKQKNGSEEKEEPTKLTFLESFKARSNDQRFQGSHNIYKEFVVVWRAAGDLREDVDALKGQDSEAFDMSEFEEELERNTKALGIAQGKIKDLEDQLKKLRK